MIKRKSVSLLFCYTTYTHISSLKQYVLIELVRCDKSCEGQVQTVVKEGTTVLITAQSNVARRLFTLLFVTLRTPDG